MAGITSARIGTAADPVSVQTVEPGGATVPLLRANEWVLE